MSQELERVYTINLGKVLLSQSQHRAVRAINMIREFARHHMKVEDIKIEEELAHQIWARGVRSPPRKIRVRMSKTDEGYLDGMYSSYGYYFGIMAVHNKNQNQSPLNQRLSNERSHLIATIIEIYCLIAFFKS